MDLAIPLAVVYAGLAGTLLALLVAAATNGWSLRVFLLLALRLAIGWHFLFEGLHKVHSYMVGPTETNRPFSSAPYFAAAEGPFGEYMRKKYLGDPWETITAKVTPKKAISPTDFAKLPEAEQAALCPDAAAQALDQPARAAYARWVYGVDARPAKVGLVSGGTATLTAPSRLAIIELLKSQVADLEARQAVGLGNGYGMDQTRLKAVKTDLRSAETELAADADQFLTELNKGAGATEAEKPIAKLDRMTMWAITAIGACLLAGFLTRPACLVAVAFLVLTYLTHPPFPWYPLPPNTEGHPIFVNKNIIEALALLVVASFPTGKWLGLDALFYWFIGRRKN
ncbi:MAG TPA: DoxX family protein [Fimbriiglobus sp.]|nr:DoxX family protein [Fimbriiglobus sp.]